MSTIAVAEQVAELSPRVKARIAGVLYLIIIVTKAVVQALFGLAIYIEGSALIERACIN